MHSPACLRKASILYMEVARSSIEVESWMSEREWVNVEHVRRMCSIVSAQFKGGREGILFWERGNNGLVDDDLDRDMKGPFDHILPVGEEYKSRLVAPFALSHGIPIRRARYVTIICFKGGGKGFQFELSTNSAMLRRVGGINCNFLYFWLMSRGDSDPQTPSPLATPLVTMHVVWG